MFDSKDHLPQGRCMASTIRSVCPNPRSRCSRLVLPVTHISGALNERKKSLEQNRTLAEDIATLGTKLAPSNHPSSECWLQTKPFIKEGGENIEFHKMKEERRYSEVGNLIE